MSTFNQLINDGTLAEVLLLIHDSSRDTLFSLLQVSREVHRCTLPLVYRECTFDFTQVISSVSDQSAPPLALKPFSSTRENIDRLFQANFSSVVFQSVRKIVLRSNKAIWAKEAGATANTPYIPSEEDVYEKWSSLVELLSRISLLKELVFDCRERVPLILLETLEIYHPSARLHVENWTRLSLDTKFGDPYEEALARSPCLRSIDVHFITGGPQMNLGEPAFQRILALSPNLESFTYRNTYAGRSCVLYCFGSELEQAASRFLVDLENSVRKDIKTIRWEDSSDLSTSMIERWGKFMNFRTIQTLDLGLVRHPEVLEYIATQKIFEGVRHLSFKLTPNSSSKSVVDREIRLRDATIGFLSSSTRLESLSIVNYSGRIDIVSLLALHGESLRFLSLHDVLVDDTSPPRPVFPIEDLHLIRTSAPQLETLKIDINFTPEGKYESEAYKILGSFLHLRTLNIYYTFKSVSKDFGGRLYWKIVGAPASKLEEINLYLGPQEHEKDRPRRRGYYPTSYPLVEIRNNHESYGHDGDGNKVREVPIVFQMERCERDDMRNYVSITILGHQLPIS
ncbi:hypothetical protein E1B28_006868 [Marasmius oreades]|uniref:Uncharacterized protein n=1 Tax=Marasmius oreades TaxID=181124 RepID=A0A9P7S0J9_9AGAR|nr:uncharacterized protein E1B28_006868 [Marasmius oreades]KAG7093179.1 hypothetical protein E1B28_006868 [Marasmius oreades]